MAMVPKMFSAFDYFFFFFFFFFCLTVYLPLNTSHKIQKHVHTLVILQHIVRNFIINFHRKYTKRGLISVRMLTKETLILHSDHGLHSHLLCNCRI